MFATLGDIKFENPNGFITNETRTETIWAEQQLVNQKAVLQAVGEKNKEITIEMLFHADYVTPADEIEKLQSARTANEPLALTYGNGTYIADFVITNISEVWNKTLPDGTILIANVSVSLKEWFVPDEDAEEVREFQAQAIALGTTPLALQSVPTPPLSPGAETVLNLNLSQITSAEIDNNVTLAERFESASAFLSDSIKKGTEVMNSSLTSVNDAIDKYENLKERAENLQESIAVAQDAIVAMQAVLPITDINDLKNANTDLQNSMNVVSLNSTNLNNAASVRRI